jgi:hypothetical protein
MIFAKFGLCYFILNSMKKLFSVLLIWVLLTSCSVLNRAPKGGDFHVRTTNIGLRQRPSAFSVETGSWKGKKVLYRLSVRLTSETQSGGKPEVRIGFRFTGAQGGELDSVMYFDLEGEKIKLVSEGYEYKQFLVPENLWISIIHSQRIGYRVYLGHKEIDVELTAAETDKVKKFFSRVIRQRDANHPGLPEGQKKW